MLRLITVLMDVPDIGAIVPTGDVYVEIYGNAVVEGRAEIVSVRDAPTEVIDRDDDERN